MTMRARPGVASDARITAALLATCWLVLTLHFATNIAREHYPAIALAEREGVSWHDE